VARTRDWHAFSGGGTAASTVNSLALFAASQPTGATLQRIVGTVDLHWYATSAEPRTLDVRMGIRRGNVNVDPTVATVNTEPESWVWFQHRRLGRTITAADSGEFRYSLHTFEVDTQGMRDMSGSGARFMIARATLASATSVLTWHFSGRALILNP
jgi:hypothetical protein